MKCVPDELSTNDSIVKGRVFERHRGVTDFQIGVGRKDSTGLKDGRVPSLVN